MASDSSPADRAVDLDPRAPLTTVALRHLDPATLERFYRDVLEPSFPPDELIPPGPLLAAAEPGATLDGAVVLHGSDPIAGAVVERYPTSGVLLLAYLAARPDQRRRGLGGALLSQQLPLWRRRHRPGLVLAEVEDPRFRPATAFGDPRARLRFYARAGAKVLPLPYFQPALGAGLDRVRHLLLITLDEPADAVAAATVNAFLGEYFEACEGGVPDDAEGRALWAAVASWPGGLVPLWPLARADDVPVPPAGDDGA